MRQFRVTMYYDLNVSTRVLLARNAADATERAMRDEQERYGADVERAYAEAI